MREYFKQQSDTKKSKFKLWCEDKGADYFENSCGVWKMPKKEGDSKAAIKVDDDMLFNIGKIDESCDNFETHYGRYYKEEALWIADTLKHIFGKK